MATYYLDKQDNYLSNLNNDLEFGDPIIKKYRPVIYKDGKFKRVKSYIGRTSSSYDDDGGEGTQNGLLTNNNLFFLTSDGSYFIPSGIDAYAASLIDDLSSIEEFVF